MAHVTIEYMIMIPVLILLIILLPYATSIIMNGWVDSRRSLVLQETASNLGSSIQQLYSALNHDTISTGNVTNKLELPMYIEGYSYSGTASLRSALDPTLNSTKVLDVTLTLEGTGISSTSAVTLGENVEWTPSTLHSNSTSLGLAADKYFDGSNFIIKLSFT